MFHLALAAGSLLYDVLTTDPDKEKVRAQREKFVKRYRYNILTNLAPELAQFHDVQYTLREFRNHAEGRLNREDTPIEKCLFENIFYIQDLFEEHIYPLYRNSDSWRSQQIVTTLANDISEIETRIRKVQELLDDEKKNGDYAKSWYATTGSNAEYSKKKIDALESLQKYLENQLENLKLIHFERVVSLTSKQTDDISDLYQNTRIKALNDIKNALLILAHHNLVRNLSYDDMDDIWNKYHATHGGSLVFEGFNALFCGALAEKICSAEYPASFAQIKTARKYADNCNSHAAKIILHGACTVQADIMKNEYVKKTIDDYKTRHAIHYKQIDAFFKIYEAYCEGKSSKAKLPGNLHYRNHVVTFEYPHDHSQFQINTNPARAINEINRYCETNPQAKQIWELAIAHYNNCSKDNVALVSAIHKMSFESSIFSRTRAFQGTTFGKDAYGNRQLTSEYINHAEEGTRTHRIASVLRK